MILWRNIEVFSLFIILIPTPDFPHFYYILGGNLGSLLYGDVSVMSYCANSDNESSAVSLKTGNECQKIVLQFRELISVQSITK